MSTPAVSEPITAWVIGAHADRRAQIVDSLTQKEIVSHCWDSLSSTAKQFANDDRPALAQVLVLDVDDEATPMELWGEVARFFSILEENDESTAKCMSLVPLVLILPENPVSALDNYWSSLVHDVVFRPLRACDLNSCWTKLLRRPQSMVPVGEMGLLETMPTVVGSARWEDIWVWWTSLLALSADGVLIFDAEGQPKVVNRAAQQILLGFDTSGQGAPWPGVFEAYVSNSETPLSSEECPIGQSVHGSRVPSKILHLRHREQNLEKWVEVSCEPLTTLGGLSYGALVVVRDLTDQWSMLQDLPRVGRQIRNAQRLEAIGQLAQGVVHDFNNLLTVILGYTEMGLRSVASMSPLFKVFEAINSAAEEGSRIARSLWSFSRGRQAGKGPVDVVARVKETCELVMRVLPKEVELHLDLPEENTIWVEAEPVRIEQIITNLVVNARDSLRGRGVIRVSVHVSDEIVDIDSVPSMVATREELVTGELSQPSSQAPWEDAKTVHLTVADTGVGIAENVRHKIFDPFFTTKSEGVGSGLGLNAVKSIVAELEGTIRYRSQLGDGTIFQISLPLVPNGGKPTDGPGDLGMNVAEAGPKVQGEVLLANGHRFVRDILATSLKKLGLTVVTVQDQSQWFDIIKDRGTDFGITILDQRLAGPHPIGGLGRARALGLASPVVVMAETYPDLSELSPAESESSARVIWLPEPFQMSTFEALVTEILNHDAKSLDVSKL